VHDYFEIVGVSPDARARDIQRACRRHAATAHPDFCVEPETPRDAPIDRDHAAGDLADAAVDFVNMTAVISRMQTAFFNTTR
jgi:hypothetical protein